MSSLLKEALKCEVTVKNHIFEFAEEMQKELKSELAELKSAEHKFSITVDEWTDINVKRYLNLNLHDVGKSFKLGLVEIKGSCNAEATQKLVEEKLLQFGLNFDDIVVSTHDGAAVMKKYGRIIPAESQTSFNHAIHLAVMDVFYKKGSIETDIDEDLIENESGDENLDENEFSETDDAAVYIDSTGDSNIHFQPQFPELIVNLRTDIKKVLAQAQKLIKHLNIQR